jgi:large repetitive protein
LKVIIFLIILIFFKKFNSQILNCWGSNSKGQLGDGTKINSNFSVDLNTTGSVLNGKSILQISTGFYFACVVANDSNSYCWGDNT